MLHYQPRAEGLTEARLGLVVGKKLLKRSVDRNRLKRIVREQFRCMRPDLPPCDFVGLLQKLRWPKTKREG